MLARFRLKKLPANGIYLQMEIVSIPYRLTLDTEVPDPFVSHQIRKKASIVHSIGAFTSEEPMEGTPYKKVILLVLYANSYADSQNLLDETFNKIRIIFHTNLYIILLSTFHANL